MSNCDWCYPCYHVGLVLVDTNLVLVVVLVTSGHQCNLEAIEKLLKTIIFPYQQ